MKIKNIIKQWLYYRPMLVNQPWLRDYEAKIFGEYLDTDKLRHKEAIKPLIESLEELRKNTWDKKRVDEIIKYVKYNL